MQEQEKRENLVRIPFHGDERCPFYSWKKVFLRKLEGAKNAGMQITSI